MYYAYFLDDRRYVLIAERELRLSEIINNKGKLALYTYLDRSLLSS